MAREDIEMSVFVPSCTGRWVCSRRVDRRDIQNVGRGWDLWDWPAGSWHSYVDAQSLPPRPVRDGQSILTKIIPLWMWEEICTGKNDIRWGVCISVKQRCCWWWYNISIQLMDYLLLEVGRIRWIYFVFVTTCHRFSEECTFCIQTVDLWAFYKPMCIYFYWKTVTLKC